MPRTHCSQHFLVDIFPIILCHQTESRQEGPTKGVKTGVPKVRVSTKTLHARVVFRAWPSSCSIPTQNGIDMSFNPVVIAYVVGMCIPCLVKYRKSFRRRFLLKGNICGNEIQRRVGNIQLVWKQQ